MDKLNWLTAYQIITKEAVLFTHKIVFNKQPQSITNLIIFSLIRFQNVHSAQKPMEKTYEKMIGYSILESSVSRFFGGVLTSK